MENNTYQSKSQKIYASMAHMSSNVEILRRYFGDSSQLTNWNLDSGTTYHMKPAISYILPGSLVEIDKYIEVADGNFLTMKQPGRVQIKMCGNNGNQSLLCYITYYWHQTCAIKYFPLLN